MKVILLVGPSGSGKDTLLRAARTRFNDSMELDFVRRYITRPPDASEDNYYVDSTCFSILRKDGFFVSDWCAHGNEYGIPRHIFLQEYRPQKLLCSISRGAVTDFENFHDGVMVIQITASKDILRQRLQGRGRESGDDIEKRLERAAKPVLAKNLITFDNSKALEESRRDFISLLEAI